MTTPPSDRTKARLRKLLELARNGVGGEADNAQRFLTNTLRRLGMTMADIEDDAQPPSLVEIAYASPSDRTLLFQVFCKVTDSTEPAVFRKGRKRAFLVELTPAQHAEVVMTMAALRPALKRHLRRALNAFVNANDLFPPTAAPAQRALTAEEKTEAWMILAMAASSETPQIRRALSGKTHNQAANA